MAGYTGCIYSEESMSAPLKVLGLLPLTLLLAAGCVKDELAPPPPDTSAACAMLDGDFDSDGDRLPDRCDARNDGDGDGDRVTDDTDNCPLVSNVSQLNTDGDRDDNACDDDDDRDTVADAQDNCPLV